MMQQQVHERPPRHSRLPPNEILVETSPTVVVSTTRSSQLSSLYTDLQAAVVLDEADETLLRELCGSVDDLAECLDELRGPDQKGTPSLKAQVISRRVTALRELAGQVQRIQDRTSHDNKLTLLATFIRLMKEALQEAGVKPDQRELIAQNLALKLEAEDTLNRKRD